MKTKNNVSCITLAGILLLAFTGPMPAQYKPTGDDGIAASPRVRAQIDERKARLKTGNATAPSMACPKCKDQYTKRVDPSDRGAAKPAVLVATHLCPACATTIGVTGVGKAKHNVTNHSCTSCGSQKLACCKTGR